MNDMNSIALLMLLAFGLNVPLGHLRARVPKFSLAWFIRVHLSIPILLVVRHHTGLGVEIAPLSIASALLGQWLGAHIPHPAHHE